MRNMSWRNNERGTSMAEFAVVATFFFMLIFGVIEFGRLLYTHNALTDAARRGARYAVLRPLNHPCVVNAVMYGETNINPTTCAPIPADRPPLINGIVPGNVVVTYAGTPGFPYGMNNGTATVTI